MNSFDVLTGLLCGGTSLVLFGLHALTARHAPRFFNLPNYVRVGVWLTSVSLMVRSVELLSMPGRAETAPGHASLAAAIASSLLLYNVAAVLYWIVSAARHTHRVQPATIRSRQP